jgi:hypothetical protein
MIASLLLYTLKRIETENFIGFCLFCDESH